MEALARLATRRPVAAQLLDVVPVPVEEPDSDQRHAEVGGRLHVVAREDTEAARVLLEALVDRELAAEVRDAQLRRSRVWFRRWRSVTA